ncbi:NAD-dependent epimerase/dehydratase family protein [Stappia stellulata]|uniref:NAD-dependent epimerase/dehydratase family protein n=1 Tax=Stappia stellulata TaxID=71235 RepID=UPI0003F8FFF2|nr:NAD(P)-dependent oxidoreductase [Stappia stellulata]
MRVLVTGGSGFVGANVVEALVSAGCFTVVLERPGAPRSPGATRFIEADIGNAAACEAALEGVRTVIHCAAVTPAGTADAEAVQRAFAINLAATAGLAMACERRGVRMIHLSSASVYGAASGGPLDETGTWPRPVAAYGISKLAAEQFVLSRRAFRLDACVLRIGSVFGPHERGTGVRDTLSALYQVTRAARSGRAVRLPRAGRRDWIYARDVAAAVLAAVGLSNLPDAPVNIAGLEEWSVADWCESLARHVPFDWRIGPSAPSVDFHGRDDRPPLATQRMRTLLGFHPTYTRDRACEDYLRWLEENEAS